jgi:hypothetical protein
MVARHSQTRRKITKLEVTVDDVGVPKDQIHHESYG